MSDEDRGDWEHDVAKDKELDRRWDEALTKAFVIVTGKPILSVNSYKP